MGHSGFRQGPVGQRHRGVAAVFEQAANSWQSVIGLLAALYLVFSISESSNLRVLELFYSWMQSGFDVNLPPKAGLLLPFMKEVSYPLGVFGFVILTYLVIVGSSNAVNLTDGLDGLAIMPVVMVGSALGVFAYVTGSSVYSKYLIFPYIPGSGELMIFCAAMAGAGLAFLWFNTYPYLLRYECLWPFPCCQIRIQSVLVFGRLGPFMLGPSLLGAWP